MPEVEQPTTEGSEAAAADEPTDVNPRPAEEEHQPTSTAGPSTLPSRPADKPSGRSGAPAPVTVDEPPASTTPAASPPASGGEPMQRPAAQNKRAEQQPAASPPARAPERDGSGEDSAASASTTGGSARREAPARAPLAKATPAAEARAARDADEEARPTHVVQPGESLWVIARRQLPAGVSNGAIAAYVNRLWQLNDSEVIKTGDPDLIYPGQELRL